jgi:hypothetical protein
VAQLINLPSGNLDPQDAGKLTAKVCHATFDPVSAVARHNFGDCFYQAWAVWTDERKND